MANENRINRRKFLGTSAAGAMGLGMISNPARAAESSGYVPDSPGKDLPFNPRTFAAMPTNSFGKTGYKIGVLSLGGQATVETAGMEEEAEKIIHRAIDLGINYIDTAAGYGRGLSQRNIGRVMKTRKNEVFLATKTHSRSYDGSMKLLEESLKSLQTDHLDLWQLHNVQRQDQVDKIFADDGAIKALEKAKSEGMVKHLGITGHYEPLILKQCIEIATEVVCF
jgi:aryl-alcohol dehydrogenase-like predicted oxidoreductase